MNLARVRILIGKEWAEAFQNKIVLATLIFMPFSFLALAAVTLAALRALPPEAAAAQLSEIPEVMRGSCEGLAAVSCVRVFIGRIYAILFMIIPLLLPSSFAAHSVAGEKAARTLEPLLAAPISTPELMIGKIVAAAVPGLLATWLAYAIYLGACAVFMDAPERARVFTIEWVLIIVGLAPVLAIGAVSIGMMISSRVNDARTAEQLSGFVVLPVVIAIVAQLGNMLLLAPGSVGIAIAVASAVDVVLVALAIRIFDRESILTRWK